jgi:hypothetical protein
MRARASGVAFDVASMTPDGALYEDADTPDFDAQAHLPPDGRQVVSAPNG